MSGSVQTVARDFGMVTAEPLPSSPVPLQSSPPPKMYSGFNRGTCKGVGIIMIITGGLCIPVQIAALVLVTSSPQVTGWGNLTGVGIWTGLVFLMTGCAAAAASETPNPSRVRVLAILSVIAVILAVPMFIFMAVSLEDADRTRSTHCRGFSDCRLLGPPICFTHSNCDSLTSVLVLSSFLLVFSLLNGTCSGYLVWLCCKTLFSSVDNLSPSYPASTTTSPSRSTAGTSQPPAYIAPAYGDNQFNMEAVGSAPPYSAIPRKPDPRAYDNNAYQDITLARSSDLPPPYSPQSYTDQSSA